MPPHVPFNRAYLTGDENRYISEAIEQGHSSAKGPFSERVVELLRAKLKAKEVLLTTSCTDALEMTAMLLNLGPGDVVIVPSFTFSSTATAFARQGAKIRFCDIAEPHLGLDPDHVEASMDGQVRAIVTVHYAGVAGDPERLSAIAERHGAVLLEDNAHGLFGAHAGTPLGAFGRMSTLSFHETKNFVCGEGGALVINDADDIERAHVLLDKGTNRRQYLEGQIDKYTWQGHGSSFGLSDLLAAFLLAQLESAPTILAKRRRIAERYRSLLEPITGATGISLPFERRDDTPADHMFYILLPGDVNRGEVIARMNADNIHPAFHYVPLHSAPGASLLADRHQDCPVSDDIGRRLLRLPFFNDVTEDEQYLVAASLTRALG